MPSLKRIEKHIPVIITLPLLYLTLTILYIAVTLITEISYPYPQGTNVKKDWLTLYKHDDTNRSVRFNLLELEEVATNATGNYIAGVDWSALLSFADKKERVEVEFLTQDSLQHLNLASAGGNNIEPEGVYITPSLAKRHHIDKGDFLYLNASSFVVTGILPHNFKGISGKAEIIANISAFISTEYHQVSQEVGRMIAEQIPLYFYFEQKTLAKVYHNKFNNIIGIQTNPTAYLELYGISYSLLFIAVFMVVITLSCEALLTMRWIKSILPRLNLQHVIGATFKNNLYYVVKIYGLPRLLVIVLIYVTGYPITSAFIDYFSHQAVFHNHSNLPFLIVIFTFMILAVLLVIKMKQALKTNTNNLAGLRRSTKKHKVSLATSLIILILAPVFLGILSIESFSALKILNRAPNLPIDNLYIVQFHSTNNTDISQQRFSNIQVATRAITSQLSLNPNYKLTSSNAAPFSPPTLEGDLVAISDRVLSKPEKVKQILISSNYQEVLQHQLLKGRLPTNSNEVAVSEGFVNKYTSASAINKSIYFYSKYTPALKIVGIIKDGYWLDPKISDTPLVWRLDKRYANGYLIIRTKDNNYLQLIKQIIANDKLALKIHKAQSASAIKSKLLAKETALLAILSTAAITIILAIFFNITAAIHNVISSKTTEIKIKLSLGASKKQVSRDILKDCYSALFGGWLWGGSFSIIIINTIYQQENYLVVDIIVSLSIILSILLISAANQTRKIYNISPNDLFKDN